MKPSIFIDGEAGTTGLQIRARLAQRHDLEIVSIDPAKRKDNSERQRLLNSVDLAVLCLHDDVARQAVEMLVGNTRTKVLDASSAHRVAPNWAYGFPELTQTQHEVVANSSLVSNPGCYATGAVALLRPLRDAGLLPENANIYVQGTSGYSGGGRQLIEAFDNHAKDHPMVGPYRTYALSLAHKHQPEMQVHGRLGIEPIFSPAVGHFLQGMLVQIPLHANTLAKSANATDLHAVYAAHYANQKFVSVLPAQTITSTQNASITLDPESLNGSNKLEVMVFGNAEKGTALLVARLDNLGKGASGAAAQNIDLMLGLGGNHDYSVS